MYRKINPVDIGRKLNVHKTFRRRLLNVLCTFNLRPMSTGKSKLLNKHSQKHTKNANTQL